MRNKFWSIMCSEISDIKLKEFSLLHANWFRTLINSLNEDYGWKKLLETLQSRGYLLDSYPVHRINVSSNHASVLLNELICREGKVCHLRKLLKEGRLWNSLSLISDPEPLIIVQQPGNEGQLFTVDDNASLSLECIGEGLPYPSYQWYFGNLEIPNGDSETLTINHFREENCGEYYCVLTHSIGNQIISQESNRVEVELTPILPRFIEDGDLQEQKITFAGQKFTLEVSVIARPMPTFVWIKGNKILDGRNLNVLVFDCIQPEDRANYRCLIRNKAGEVASKTCSVDVIMGPEQSLPNHAVTHKIALLIGNSAYINHPHLNSPIEDVVTIAQQLRSIGFHVIALQNLTKVEMEGSIQWFREHLPPHSYGLFYFVGHGFSTSIGNYMMPVDVPESPRPSDCYSDEKLIKNINETNTRLFVFILDMCFAHLDGIVDHEEQDISYERKPNVAIVRLQSACDHSRAYESANRRISLYGQCLAKYLAEDIPVNYMAQLVSEAFTKCPQSQIQSPYWSSNDGCRLRLTDPLISYGELTKTHMEMNSWNDLKDREELRFNRVGLIVVVKLSFHQRCFHNALDVIFPRDLTSRWIITAELNHENLTNYRWNTTSEEEELLTIYDLQKAVTSICITIKLNKFSDNHAVLQMVDFSQFDIDLGIVDKKLSL